MRNLLYQEAGKARRYIYINLSAKNTNEISVLGHEHHVLIDERCFRKRKFHTGRLITAQQWVFGVIDLTTKKCFSHVAFCLTDTSQCGRIPRTSHHSWHWRDGSPSQCVSLVQLMKTSSLSKLSNSLLNNNRPLEKSYPKCESWFAWLSFVA